MTGKQRLNSPRGLAAWALLLGTLGLSDPFVAAEPEWLLTLDPAATEIRFTLGATLHEVHGGVKLESGELRFDPVSGALAGEVVVDARSAETGNEGRDRDMHRKVLESDGFPSFVFASRKLVGDLALSGPSRVEIYGELRIHGETHPLVLPAEIQFDGESFSVKTSFAVPYVDWGMKDPSKLLLRVEKVVQVVVTAVGTRRQTAQERTVPEASGEGGVAAVR